MSSKVIFSVIPYASSDWEKAIQLREAVLRKPLGTVFTPDELDAEADHIQVVGKRDGTIVATAVLVPKNSSMKMQRVVVTDELRNQHIGSRMMEFCESIAVKQGCKLLYCHARDSAVRFYKNNLWLPEGDYFDEDGIPHLKMLKRLD